MLTGGRKNTSIGVKNEKQIHFEFHLFINYPFIIFVPIYISFPMYIFQFYIYALILIIYNIQ